MSQRNPFWGNGKINTGSIIIGLVVLLLILFGLMSLAQLTYRLLSFVAIPLLVITAIIDYKVITNYVSWLVSLIKRNTILGVVLSLLSTIAYPITTAFLFGRALIKRSIRKQIEKREEVMQQQTPQIGEYIDFEEIQEAKSKAKQKQKQTRNGNSDYDSFFE